MTQCVSDNMSALCRHLDGPVTTSAFNSSIKQCTSLTAIHFNTYPSEHDKFVDVFERLPKLRHLDLHGCKAGDSYTSMLAFACLPTNLRSSAMRAADEGAQTSWFDPADLTQLTFLCMPERYWTPDVEATNFSSDDGDEDDANSWNAEWATSKFHLPTSLQARTMLSCVLFLRSEWIACGTLKCLHTLLLECQAVCLAKTDSCFAWPAALLAAPAACHILPFRRGFAGM